jgi:alpha-N-arabinofuranosidase
MCIRKITACLALAFLGLCFRTPAQTNYSIYSDEVDNGFQNWSYGPYNFESTNPVYSGTYAITLSNAWNGISFEHSDFNPAPYTNLTFFVNGGATGGQIVQVNWQYDDSASNGLEYQLPALPTNSWRQFNLPLATLGVAGVTNLSRLNFQLTAYGSTAVFSLDSVSLSTVPPALIQVSVDASQTIRAADARWFGLNTAVWDGYFDTPYTAAAVAQLGTQILRFPGGSTADDYHWASNTTDTNTWTWATSFSSFIQIATNAHAQAMITVNYGSGTPQEAAAWVRAANITNHCNFANWEIGNEEYGSWETDTNTNPHDPYTYATRAAQYIAQMKAVDSTIKIGVVATPGENAYVNSFSNNHPAVNPRTGTTNYGWTPILLATLKSLGVTPDFLIHHVYPEYEVDDDQTLLQYSTNWASDAALLRQEISDYFGTGGTNIQLVCTENNADSGDQGKQSTSIVNGLYLADSLAQLMKTEIDGFIWWDLRNGQDTSGDFSSDLYGWRTYGDLGIIGGANINYPTYYSTKLMQYYMRPGDTVLNAASDYFLISSYAARKADGALDLLLINKNETAPLATQIILTNFFPWSTATVRSYGMAEDEATRTNGPAAAQDIATNYFTAASTNFMTNLPPYSLTLFTFAPAAPRMQTIAATAGNVILQLQGQAGVPYQIQTSTNLISWTSNTTATLTATQWSSTNTVSSGAKYWRAVWLP